jgi:valyl-tRNA synthetase
MPFVTEEIWAYHPARDGHLVVHAFPEADDSLIDEDAEDYVAGAIALTRSLRAWRDMVGVPAKAVLPAVVDGIAPSEFVGRLSRFAFDGVGSQPVASVGPVRVLASEAFDAEAVEARLAGRRKELQSEIDRAERKLGNEGFVAKAPVAVVEEERGKLDRYKKELAELEGA